VISSTRSGLTFFSNGCIAAPILFLKINRISPYKMKPVPKDQISVLNFFAAFFPCNQPGASNQASCPASVINSPSCGPAIGGKLYSTCNILSPEGYSNVVLYSNILHVTVE